MLILWDDGVPGGETEVPSWVMFQSAFVSHHVGYAAAIATALTVIISLVAIGINQLSRGRS